MLTSSSSSWTPAAPSVVLAAQLYLDQLQSAISLEAQMVAAALSNMTFDHYAVDGPMLTGAWGGGADFVDVT